MTYYGCARPGNFRRATSSDVCLQIARRINQRPNLPRVNVTGDGMAARIGKPGLGFFETLERVVGNTPEPLGHLRAPHAVGYSHFANLAKPKA